MKIVICQLNPLVGDISGNTSKIFSIVEEYRSFSPDLVIFPELFLEGYPPRDLLEKSWFIQQSIDACEKITDFSKKYPETGILFGTILPSEKLHGKKLINAAVLVNNGKAVLHQHKKLLPTYDIFDETRYFEPASIQNIIDFKGEKLGITICEDAWNISDFSTIPLYDKDPIAEIVKDGATILINISASPFHIGKEQTRYNIMRNHAIQHRLPFIFVNQIGGNDELIFDGNSMIIDENGILRHQLPAFKEATFLFNTEDYPAPISVPIFDRVGSIHEALICGVHDYVTKCGFSKVIIGLSGGIDSALTAVIAAKALGSENVWGVTMPSRFSSTGSIDDSKLLADRLGITFSCIPIEESFIALLNTLKPFFTNTQPNIAEENLQARIRGTILMALSNKFNMLLLSTGNKSEMAVGYSTLYGDMNGGLCVISDLPKETVYQLAEYINSKEMIIPKSIIEKAPSAELRPNQKDQDTLPPYPVLDAILERIVERGYSQKEIVAEGFEPSTVAWVAQAIARSEYKRRQAPIGLKVTPKAFGSGRRFPVAARYDWS
jgi:NAD+ synthase (glutamine-hydrolysing)